MQILLVQAEPHLPSFRRGDHTCLNGLKSHGLSMIGAVLRQEGYQIKILQQGFLTNEELLETITDSDTDLLGFSSMSYDYPVVCEIIKGLSKNLPVIIGGSHISIVPEQLPHKLNCFGVIGEGEETVLELVQTLNRDKDVSSIKGLCWRKNDKLVFNPLRERMSSLNELPFSIPATEILEKPFVGKLMYPTVADQKGTELTVAQRGCPFNCSFCSSQYIWRRIIRAKSVQNVADEFDDWAKKGVNCAFLADLMVNANPEYAKELFKELIKRNNQIKIYTMMRLADMQGHHLFDEEMIGLSAKAGVAKLGVGLESFSPLVQKRYRKVYELEIAKNFFCFCDKYGILSKGFLIIGPEDTQVTIQNSLEILQTLLPDEIRISFEVDFSPEALNEAFKNGTLSNFHTDATVLPGHLTPDEQKQARTWMRKSYYDSREWQNHKDEKIKDHSHLEEPFSEYTTHLRNLGVL